MIKKIVKVVLTFVISLCFLVSCKDNIFIPNNDVNTQVHAIYELAVKDGFEGTFEEWLDSLHGVDGHSPVVTIGPNGNWFIDGVDTNISASGTEGKPGQDGRGIVKIEKTATVDNVDTYTIYYTDDTTSTFTVTNGLNGSGEVIEGKPGQDGHTPVIEIGPNGNWFIDGVDTNIKAKGENGLSFLQGQGVPLDTLGVDGDSYLDNVNMNLYHKNNGKWELTSSLANSDYVLCQFVNYDGSLLYSDIYPKGSDIVYGGELPTKPSDFDIYGEVKYQFLGWDKPLTKVEKSTIFKATFNDREYTCTYYDYNGNVIHTSNVKYGETSSCPIDMKTYSAPIINGLYSSFIRWNNDETNITSNRTFRPVYFNPCYIKYMTLVASDSNNPRQVELVEGDSYGKELTIYIGVVDSVKMYVKEMVEYAIKNGHITISDDLNLIRADRIKIEPNPVVAYDQYHAKVFVRGITPGTSTLTVRCHGFNDSITAVVSPVNSIVVDDILPLVKNEYVTFTGVVQYVDGHQLVLRNTVSKKYVLANINHYGTDLSKIRLGDEVEIKGVVNYAERWKCIHFYNIRVLSRENTFNDSYQSLTYSDLSTPGIFEKPWSITGVITHFNPDVYFKNLHVRMDGMKDNEYIIVNIPRNKRVNIGETYTFSGAFICHFNKELYKDKALVFNSFNEVMAVTNEVKAINISSELTDIAMNHTIKLNHNFAPSNSYGNIQYSVEEVTGKASIVGNTLVALYPGSVNVYATCNGIVSNKLTFNIYDGHCKNITDVKKYAIGSYVTIEGYVEYIEYMRMNYIVGDSTGSVIVYNKQLNLPSFFKVGASVRLTGQLIIYNGTIEIGNVSLLDSSNYSPVNHQTKELLTVNDLKYTDAGNIYKITAKVIKDPIFYHSNALCVNLEMSDGTTEGHIFVRPENLTRNVVNDIAALRAGDTVTFTCYLAFYAYRYNDVCTLDPSFHVISIDNVVKAV